MYEIRQSKSIFLLACLSVIIFELIFCGIAIVSIIDLCNFEELNYDEYLASIIVLISCILFIVTILIIFIYIVYNFINQVDVYTKNKMYRKKGKKIIFELDYKDIVSVKRGFLNSLYIFCKQPIIKSNGKKGPKTIYENYSKNDIYKIEQLLANREYLI